jgi:PAS domain S-box-containing protein
MMPPPPKKLTPGESGLALEALTQHELAEERFSAIFQFSPVAIAFGKMDGRLIDVNPEFCAFFGYCRDEVIGCTTRKLLLWANPEDREAAIARVRTEKTLRNYETKFRRKSGELCTALVSMELLQFANEAILLMTIVDIEERKVLEAQLHRKQRIESVGQIASGIAHDMNNILAPIMMSAPLLRMALSPVDKEKTLSMIETCAQRGAALVRQLMIFGRGIEGERRPVRPADIVAEVTKLAGQTFPRNIAIISNVPPNAWPVRGDTTQLQQVMLNLCVNARDAMPSGGTLTISTENVEIDAQYSALHPDSKPGRYVLIRVTDTGVGVAPENMERIFDPFFTTKEIGEGTGFGLSNVLGIVKSHRGFVRLNSTVGRGTTFEVHLPASPELKDVPLPESAAAPTRGCGELIMVVDDEEQIRAALRETLERYNYKVVTAEDGVAATAIFADHKEARLVVTDLDMPLMDGVNLSRVLRRMNPAVKIVISTGLSERHGTGKRKLELDALGVSAILTKPYTADKILRTVHVALLGENNSASPK